jgi:4-alpha-glucanotransferase
MEQSLKILIADENGDFRERAKEELKKQGFSRFEEATSGQEALEIIEQIYESPAVLAMLQLQDVLMLGEEARMNVPGISEGNWTWKAAGSSIEEAFPDAVERAEWLSDLSQKTGRLAR